MPDNNKNDTNWSIIAAGVFFIFIGAVALIGLDLDVSGYFGVVIILLLGFGLLMAGSPKPESKS